MQSRVVLVRERSPLSHMGLGTFQREGVISLLLNPCSVRHKLIIDRCFLVRGVR